VELTIPGVAVTVAATRAQRRRGLLGRDRVDGVLVLAPCRQVHTVGMRCPIDVAFVARTGRVLRVVTMPPGRVSRPVLRSCFVLEGPAGAFSEWGITRGRVLFVREDPARGS
jgi:hypothetical protein